MFWDDFIAKILIAALLGFVMGIERELKKKPLGLKTCIVIAVTSCLLMIISRESAEQFIATYKMQADPMRLGAQIVSGIGFIGAGVILKRNNDAITGLTTAAMIWAASAIGIAVGAGFTREAIAALTVIIVAVEFIPYILKKVGPAALSEKELKISMVIKDGVSMTELLKTIKSLKTKVNGVKVEDTDGNHKTLELRLSVHQERYTTDVYYDIKKLEGVVSVLVETI